jgi:hypothetical protein
MRNELSPLMRGRRSRAQPKISMTMRRSSILSIFGISGLHSDGLACQAASFMLGGSEGEPLPGIGNVSELGSVAGRARVGSSTAGAFMWGISQ